MLKNKHNEHKIYIRIIFLFLFVIIPLEIFVYGIFQLSSNTIEKQISESADTNVTYLDEQFETAIHNINSQLQHLIVSDSVVSILTQKQVMSDSKFYMTIRDIQNILRLQIYNNSFIDGIAIFYLPLEFSISTEDSRAVDIQTIWDNIDIFREQGLLLTLRNGEYFVGCLYPVALEQISSQPYYYIEASLSQDALKNLLTSYNTYSSENALMLNQQTGDLLASPQCIPIETTEKENLLQISSLLGNEDVTHTPITLNSQRYVAILKKSSALNTVFIQLVAENILYGTSRRFRIYSFGFMFLSVLIALFFLYKLHKMIQKPMHRLRVAFQQVGRGDFSVFIDEDYKSEFNILKYGLNRMVQKIRVLIDHDYRQRILIQESSLKLLQSQINPHFLYNSFFFVQNMIDAGDLEIASRFLSYLSVYYQYITHYTEDTTVLRNEFSHARNYLAIQEMRFDFLLTTQIDELPEQWAEEKVPRLILQPLLENIFEHGMRSDEISQIVKISFAASKTLLTITIEDNGNQLDQDGLTRIIESLSASTAQAQGLALSNINKRLQLYYNVTNNLLLASRSPLGGLRITLTLSRKGRDTNEQLSYTDS